MSPDDPRHGSVSGYGQHHKTATLPACDPCKAAMARYQNHRTLMLMRGESSTVLALGTIRRIRALVAIGWPMPALSERLGTASPQSVQNLVRKPGDTRILRSTAEKIAALYDELHMLPGPSPISATRAARKGWAPPLAWDDIDDASEVPTGFRVCAAPGCAGNVRANGLCSNCNQNRARRLAS